jgi:hypothetical protein
MLPSHIMERLLARQQAKTTSPKHKRSTGNKQSGSESDSASSPRPSLRCAGTDISSGSSDDFSSDDDSDGDAGDGYIAEKFDDIYVFFSDIGEPRLLHIHDPRLLLMPSVNPNE